MSVTQAKRTLAYRDQLGGFSSTEDLNEIPGLPIDFLAQLKRRTHV
jgi:DNA uptake protein ComE-like DNA-binding protein